MPDPTAISLRQPRRRADSARLAAAVCALALAACPSRTDVAPPATTEVPGSGDAVPAAANALPTMPNARFVGALAGVDHPLDARHVDALLPIQGGWNVIGAERQRLHTTLRTWRIEDGSTDLSDAPPPVAIRDELRISHAGSPFAAPTIVPLPDGRALSIRATDSIADPGSGASFLVRPISAEGDVADAALPVEIADWTFRSGWSAAPLGDDVLICALGCGPDCSTVPAGDPDQRLRDRLACGVLSADGQWSLPLAMVAESDDGDASLTAPFVGGGAERGFVSWYDPSHEGGRVRGALISREGDALVLTAPATLTPGPFQADASYAHRRPPHAVSTPREVAFAFPGFEGRLAYAGAMLSDGTVRGTVGQIGTLSSLTERPRTAFGDTDTLLMFDAVGERGERSTVVFQEDGPLVTDFDSLFADTDPRRGSRLGATFGDLVLYVYALGDGTGVTLLELDAL